MIRWKGYNRLASRGYQHEAMVEVEGDPKNATPPTLREGAIVFEGIDFFGVWFLLMLRSQDRLARRYLNLDGKARSREEIAALLRARAQPVLR